MVSDSRLTLRSAITALLLSQLVTAEPIRLYGRQAPAASGSLSASAATPTGAAGGAVDASGASGGDQSNLASGVQSGIPVQSGAAATGSPDLSSLGSTGRPPAASGLEVCGSQYYSPDKVRISTLCNIIRLY